jgi:hypothetical protein
VTVPADDLHLTFDGADVASLPSTILVAASLDAALEEMEAALLSRTRHALEETESRPTAASLVLLGSPAPYAERRLQAVLDNGSALGLAGVLLGQWRPGATVRVRHDSTVSATSPGLGNAPTGTRLFTLPAADTTELLAVLRAAESYADESSPDAVPGTADNEDKTLPVDDCQDDDNVQQSSSASQPTVQQLTQLESTRPPEPGEGAAYVVSRSRMRNRNRVIRSSRFIRRLRVAWVVQAAVGCAVTPRMWTRRVWISMTNRT